MNHASETRPRWTARQILVGQTLHVLILTVIFYILVDHFLGRSIELLLLTIHLSWVPLLLRQVCALLVFGCASVAILLAVSNLKLSRMGEAQARIELMEKSHFKWNAVFSVIFGYFMLYVLFSITQAIFYDDLLLSLATTILSIVAAVFCAKRLNRFMIRTTKGNQLAIEDLTAGYCDLDIPPQFRNSRDILELLHILDTAQASTVKGAVLLYRFKRVLIPICSKTLWLGRILMFGIAILTMGAVRLRNSAVAGTEQMIWDGYRNIQNNMQREEDISRLANEIANRLR